MRWTLLLLVFAAGCGSPEAPPNAGGKGDPSGTRRSFPVEVLPVRCEDVCYTIEAVGSIEANENVSVSARVAGVVEKVRFEEGQAVTPETVLAEIDPAHYQVLAERTAAAHQKAQAELARAEMLLANRKALRDKDSGYVAAEEWATLAAQVAIAKAEAAQTQAALDLARQDLDHARVRPLVAGTISTRSVATGQHLAPGALIATIVDASRLKLRFKVTESESVKLRALKDGGGNVSFTVRCWSGTHFSAKLLHVSPEADPRTRAVECLALIENPMRPLFPGLFAVIKTVVETRAKAIVIPDTAILPSERGTLAYVVEGGKARARQVLTGLFVREGAVEILEGLREGEALVVIGAAALREGAEVAISGGNSQGAPGAAEVQGPTRK